MKKVLSAVACAAVIGWTGVAMAVPTTWVDYVDVDPDALVPPAYTIHHDISDGANGFSSLMTSGNDTISNVSLEIRLYDDKLGTSYTFWGTTFTTPDGGETALVGYLGLYNFNLFSNTYSGNLAAGVDVWWDGKMDVTIASLGGDFKVDWSRLTVSGDNGVAPVPEPTTMLLFGTGLLGLAAVGRRRPTTKA
jgi:hypothetical protein